MKVILLEDIKGVGKKDDVINAADGYARNFLFPKKLALEANNDNMNKLNAKKASKQRQKDIEKEMARQTAEKMKNIIVKVEVKAGGNGKIFGGVTSKEISDALIKEHKIEIDKKKIILDETIKTLGMHIAQVRLYEGISANLKIEVIPCN